MFKNDTSKFRVFIQTKDGIAEHEFKLAIDASQFITKLPDGTLYAFRLVGDARPVGELTMKRSKA